MDFLKKYFEMFPLDLKKKVLEYYDNIIIRNNKYIFISKLTKDDYRYNILSTIHKPFCTNNHISANIGRYNRWFTISYYYRTNIYTISRIAKRNMGSIGYKYSTSYKIKDDGEIQKINEWYNTSLI